MQKEVTKEEKSVFENGLLYGVYAVVSHKTVRQKEKFVVRWRNRDKSIPGITMEQTNRGYFIDGYNVDLKSANLWFASTKNDKNNKFGSKNKK